MLKIKPYYYKIAMVFALLLLVLYFAMIFIGQNGLQELNYMKQELKNINAKNERIKQDNVELYQKIERIKADPAYMENMARQELKMIGKDEKVFKFDDKDPSKNNISPSKTEAAPVKDKEAPQENTVDPSKSAADNSKTSPDTPANH